jgi:DNA-binding beta-propeller fold protein YncE
MIERARWSFALPLAAIMLLFLAGDAAAQADMAPVNDLSNPYKWTHGYLRMPVGRSWGAVGAVDVDPDGKSIWVAERCGSDSLDPRFTPRGCHESSAPPVMKFTPDGVMVRSFGSGLFATPHGIHVDADGNVWVTDAPFTSAGTGGAALGHHVTKFSPDGEIILRLGVPGETGDDQRHFNMPSDVITAPNGDIFVADGHGGNSNARIVKFSADGTFLKTWGERGSAPGQFDGPHGLAMDSQGRLFVADRSNNRIQIFDQEGNFLDEWYQFSRLSGIHIDENDVLYGVDSESNAQRGREQWQRGIRVGSARTGEVWFFIPDLTDRARLTSTGGEGIVADRDGVIYSAEVGNRTVVRYHRFIDP